MFLPLVNPVTLESLPVFIPTIPFNIMVMVNKLSQIQIMNNVFPLGKTVNNN